MFRRRKRLSEKDVEFIIDILTVRMNDKIDRKLKQLDSGMNAAHTRLDGVTDRITRLSKKVNRYNKNRRNRQKGSV